MLDITIFVFLLINTKDMHKLEKEPDEESPAIFFFFFFPKKTARINS